MNNSNLVNEVFALTYHLIDTLTSKALSVSFSFEAGLVPLQQPQPQAEVKEHPDMRNFETLNHHVPVDYEDYDLENKRLGF
jgi:hypothetical protein